MMLLCILIGIFLKHANWKSPYVISSASIFLVMVLLYTNYSLLSISPVLPDSTINLWAKIRMARGIGLNGFPANDLLSLQDQQQVVNYVNNDIKQQDRVYYIAGFLNAEISALSGKVFYPLQRYINLKQINPQGSDSFVIIGPYQQGFWALTPTTYLASAKKALCRKVEFQNPSYTVCSLKRIAVNQR
jgi:hypothetical protein